MVTIGDLSAPNNIHPAQKRQVAERLLLAALDRVYGEPHEYCGPLYRSFERDGNGMILHIDHAESGLVEHEPLIDLWVIDHDGFPASPFRIDPHPFLSSENDRKVMK